MTERDEHAGNHDRKLKLLGVASLSRKMAQGISLEELYRDAERKFDILTELLTDRYSEGNGISGFGYSLDELREASLKTFSRLISEGSSSPHMTLCVSEEAPLEEVRRRRNKLLQIYHPDRSWVSWADETKTRKINDAYDNFVINNRNMAYGTRAQRRQAPLSFIYRNRQGHRKRRIIIAAVVIFVLFWALFLKLLHL